MSFPQSELEREVEKTFGILPNFFRAAPGVPNLNQELWQFARAAYIDSAIPSLLKERLFVYLSQFCEARYCIVRHCGFLVGLGYPAGDPASVPASVDEVVTLLSRPLPAECDMPAVYEALNTLIQPLAEWPRPDDPMEESLFAAATVTFTMSEDHEHARAALAHALGAARSELLFGFLAFVRTVHFWSLLRHDLEIEPDVRDLMCRHQALADILLRDPSLARRELASRLTRELDDLRHGKVDCDALRSAKSDLEKKDRQKNEFIAMLGHELRNPLAVIRGSLDVLGLMAKENPRLEKICYRLERHIAAMVRMVDDLLDVSRFNAGVASIEQLTLDVNEVLRACLEDYEARFMAAGLELVINIPDQQACILGDRIRLFQIFDNILTNALRFTPGPGRIFVCSRIDTDSIRIEITDTGIGFDPSIVATMFQPFFQEEQPLDRPKGGLGLGLAIGQILAEAHGGKLSAFSAGRGKGASFYLDLPRMRADVAAESPPHRLADRQRKRILLVEDNTDVVEVITELLEMSGFEVRTALDGLEGVSLARALRPDLILCDLGLPGIDGYEVARRCREDPALRDVMIVAVSGYARPEDRCRAVSAGFNQLFAKPIRLDAIETLFRQA